MTEASTSKQQQQQQQQPPPPPAAEETYGSNSLLWLSYATIIGLWFAAQYVYIPYVANCIVMVAAILYVACHWSLALREDDPPTKDGEEEVEKPPSETLTASDAAQFPIIGSMSLFGLYCAFKYLDKAWVNFIIGGYFGLVGCFALVGTLAPLVLALLRAVAGKKKNDDKPHALEKTYKYEKSFKTPAFVESVLGPAPFDIELEFQTIDILVLIPSALLCGFYLKTRHWTLNNILGICFCLQGIRRFSLGTYKTGAILLVGLFFYDIFWVFGTDVMVTVAKSLDGPIKILFPRSLTPNEETGKLDLALLGLGDIVIPGFFLAILLRFDAHQAGVSTSYTDVHANFPKPYFNSALISYIIGMSTTMAVMIFFNAAQPALLYLVPACLISSLGCAFLRGEVKELLAYSEEDEETKGDDSDAAEEETKKDK